MHNDKYSTGPALARLAAAVLTLALAACSGGGGSATPAPVPAPETAGLSQAAQLGEKIFKDVSLSASGKQSCASCHSPDQAHGPVGNLSAELGGPNGDTQGFRASPSLRYLNQTPAFFFDKEGTPTGGIDRDGRAQSLAEQAERPFLAPHEMANASKEAVVASLRKTGYAEQFRQQFGAAIFEQPEQAFSRITFALQQYQKEDTAFHPFDSKYDQFLAGKVKLADAELRGLALFNDTSKGNCIGCHASMRGADGAPPLFTDFTYDNLGVPRNARLKATADPAYFDLGLCGPDRTDLAARADLCGAFKVPTLRNVATRHTFFHNGAFDNLKDVVAFYVRRDTNPEEWYPLGADGKVDKFNDLPAQYRRNVNISEVPYNRQPGMAPALSPAEIDDVVQFLGTLTDGYRAP
ncbi:cytochrome-c peroxidase [Rugamonas sp. DEMB1]|uniref:cytochrome-c peroxidase n=1 Tax=Rugamonas sp. DEMB1 TaxID=3039386 RepID=UPI0024489FF7|nr:cytochrome c peroxidase [Rugamonas sp. DEMB1]WGG51119.1 cytochrome c peroxidase [Rugamonas sp. DEMB1]